MKATSSTAQTAYATKLEWAAKYGPDQIEHSFRHMLESFEKRAFIAAMAVSTDNVLAKHAECLSTGFIDRNEDRSVTFSAVSLEMGDALSVRYPDGQNLLFAWETDERHTSFHVVPWRDPVPEPMIEHLSSMLKQETVSDEAYALSKSILEYSGIPLKNPSYRPIDYHLSVNDIRDHVKYKGFDNIRSELGTFVRREIAKDVYYYDTFYPPKGDIPLIQRVFDLFADDQKAVRGLPDDAIAHLSALREGTIDEFLASSSTYVFEHNLDKLTSAISAMADAGHRLKLSQSTCLAYGDTDRRTYTDVGSNHVLYMHENIDMNEGCAYATVITEEDGEHKSIDVYLVDRRDPDGWGPEQPQDREPAKFLETSRYHDRDWIKEADLIDALAEGKLPATGKAMSYDHAAKTLEIFPAGRQTGYLDYLPLMIDGDLEAVLEADQGVFAEWGTEFQVKREDGEIDCITPEDYMRNISGPAVVLKP